ncbi:MAG: DNA translocase FtsK 4TM domain-containing protein [Bacteroidales bacterium]
MQEDSFNPDILNEDTNKSNIKRNKDKTSFLKNKRFRFVVGVILSFIAIYLFSIFLSYFNSGIADQSKIANNTAMEIAKMDMEIANNGGSLGASLSHTIIHKWIGFSAFILVIWFGVIGLRLIGIKFKHVKPLNFTLISLYAIISSSMFLGFINCYIDTNILLGGYNGYYSNLFMIKYLGGIGTFLFNLILIILLVVFCIDGIIRIYKKVNNRFPNLKIKRATKEKKEKKAEPKFEDFETQDTPTTQQEEIPEIKIEGATPKPIKKPSKKVTKIDESDEIEMIIETGEIEKSTTITNIYDPTAELSHYKFPTIDMLHQFSNSSNNVDINEQDENKAKITKTLNDYGIDIKNIKVCVGPTITLFEIVPSEGVRIAKIKNLEDDIALSLSALGIRIIAPIPGRGTIGIEVPNKEPRIVSMRSIIESKKYQECDYELPMAIGSTISNEVYIKDLCKMPHMLVAGATGQGKSVGLNAIITSLIYKKHPAELKFVLIDPKMVEFSLYSKLEHHYLAKLPDEQESIITDPQKVIATLNSIAIEMDNRYTMLRNANVRNIKEYNQKFVNHRLNPENGHMFLPYIVVIIDEFCDLIMMAGKEVEMPIARIAQKARAVGIHMIIATQRPSTNVITGIIKANFPGRIAFRVTQMVDSRTILDSKGAQQLIGRGDMLFLANGEMDRVQCAFIDTPEVETICEHIDTQIGYENAYELPEYIANQDNLDNGAGNINDRDPLFEEAAAFIVGNDTASTSSLQRRYAIGYNRAGKIMDQLEAAGIVSPSQGGKPRKVLIDSIQLSQIFGRFNEE